MKKIITIIFILTSFSIYSNELYFKINSNNIYKVEEIIKENITEPELISESCSAWSLNEIDVDQGVIFNKERDCIKYLVKYKILYNETKKIEIKRDPIYYEENYKQEEESIGTKINQVFYNQTFTKVGSAFNTNTNETYSKMYDKDLNTSPNEITVYANNSNMTLKVFSNKVLNGIIKTTFHVKSLDATASVTRRFLLQYGCLNSVGNLSAPLYSNSSYTTYNTYRKVEFQHNVSNCYGIYFYAYDTSSGSATFLFNEIEFINN